MSGKTGRVIRGASTKPEKVGGKGVKTQTASI